MGWMTSVPVSNGQRGVARQWGVALVAMLALVLAACGDSRSKRHVEEDQPQPQERTGQVDIDEPEEEEEINYADLSDEELAAAVRYWEEAFVKLFQLTDRLREQHFLPSDRKVNPRAGLAGIRLAEEIGVSTRFFRRGMGTFEPNNFVLERFESTVRFTFKVSGRNDEVVRYQADSAEYSVELPASLEAAKWRARESRHPGFDWIKIAFGNEHLQRSRFALQAYLNRVQNSNRTSRINGPMPMRQVWQVTGTPRNTGFYGADQFELAAFDPDDLSFRIVLTPQPNRVSNHSQMSTILEISARNWVHIEPPPQVSTNGDDNDQSDNDSDRDPNGGGGPVVGPSNGSRDPDPIPDNLPDPVIWIEVTGELVESEHWPEDYQFDGRPIAEAIADSLRNDGFRIARRKSDANGLVRVSCTLSIPRAPIMYLGEVSRVFVLPRADFEYEDRRREHRELTSYDMGGQVPGTSWDTLFTDIGRSVASRNHNLIAGNFPRN